MKERPTLQHLLARLRRGGTLVVWKLNRLGRSLKELVALVTGFQDKGIHFVSLQDHLDTTTAQGRLMFSLFASLAEISQLLGVGRATIYRYLAHPGVPTGGTATPT